MTKKTPKTFLKDHELDEETRVFDKPAVVANRKTKQ